MATLKINFVEDKDPHPVDKYLKLTVKNIEPDAPYRKSLSFAKPEGVPAEEGFKTVEDPQPYQRITQRPKSEKILLSHYVDYNFSKVNNMFRN